MSMFFDKQEVASQGDDNRITGGLTVRKAGHPVSEMNIFIQVNGNS